MQRLKVDQDIRPMSEFRTGIASFLKQVHDTKRPLVITQHGKGVAVLLDVAEYEAMQEKISYKTCKHLYPKSILERALRTKTRKLQFWNGLNENHMVPPRN